VVATVPVRAPAVAEPAPEPPVCVAVPAVRRTELEACRLPETESPGVDDPAGCAVAAGELEDGDVDAPPGSEAGCVVNVGVLTVGARVGTVATVGVLSDGVVMLGVVAWGVETVPMPTDGTVTEGTVTDGSVVEGAVVEGAVIDGTVTGNAEVRVEVIVGAEIAKAPDVPTGVAPASRITQPARTVRTERLM
jgi:hypothetical protein